MRRLRFEKQHIRWLPAEKTRIAGVYTVRTASTAQITASQCGILPLPQPASIVRLMSHYSLRLRCYENRSLYSPTVTSIDKLGCNPGQHQPLMCIVYVFFHQGLGKRTACATGHSWPRPGPRQWATAAAYYATLLFTRPAPSAWHLSHQQPFHTCLSAPTAAR
jgi:hypothetical protein